MVRINQGDRLDFSSCIWKSLLWVPVGSLHRLELTAQQTDHFFILADKDPNVQKVNMTAIFIEFFKAWKYTISGSNRAFSSFLPDS